MTIAIVGTHGAGKFSIGSALAKLLGFHFDPELGEIYVIKIRSWREDTCMEMVVL